MTTIHRATLDVERNFRLTPHAIAELEKITSAGIGAIIRRVIDEHAFAHAELIEIVRLALIGGGTAETDAAQLVAEHVTAKPIVHARLLAVDILRAAYFGAAEPEANNGA
ncbi:gene transfer agent family protein [Chelatococcus sambhunathii]|uniref:Gene transfer agent family protein n=1 Tax=Chelatococcus sambhunathii TaxID=363953 RepID=A0ABU1DF86_9HYPH|nr:gene transfer agent family protein [Chelatococcus sambhunathii]MDR4306575.1 gene transfer agent family protein [Chelatococcus sambhunathii]